MYHAYNRSGSVYVGRQGRVGGIVLGKRMAGLILGTMPFIIVLICLWIMWIPLKGNTLAPIGNGG